jgi:anti-sigma B factor antagonist
MAMEQLRLRVHRGEHALVLTVSGELDVVTGPQLDRQFAAFAAAGDHRVVLDVANLTFCDARGISVLLRARTAARREHGWLRLAAARTQLRRILAITDLTRVLTVFDSVADAMEGAQPPAVPPLQRAEIMLP